MTPRVYLAGPDVFLPDAAARAAAKRAVCARHGLDGVSPLDPLADEPASWAELAEWQRIARRNEAHIAACAAVLADLTPFRGPSADAGTVYEIGFARGLGRKVFGYSNVATPYTARVLAALVPPATPEGADWRDADGMLVEAFGLHDNLMIDNAVLAAGRLIVEERPPARRWRDLDAFERCVVAAAADLCRGLTRSAARGPGVAERGAR
jgi:nucleoside 2-deoxyribosyltransferase